MSRCTRLTSPRALSVATALAAAVAIAPHAAHADIISALSAAPTQTSPGSGVYAYTYNVQLSGGQLDRTNGSTISPTPLQFGTVYDFGNMLRYPSGQVVFSATGILASNFSFSFDAISTPTAYATAPTDNAALDNIRFTYTGTTNYVVGGSTTTDTTYTTLASGATNLGTFIVYSLLSTFSTTGANYDGQTYKGANDTIQGNVGLVGVPVVVVAVPEPASLAILATGAVGFGLLRRRPATQV